MSTQYSTRQVPISPREVTANFIFNVLFVRSWSYTSFYWKKMETSWSLSANCSPLGRKTRILGNSRDQHESRSQVCPCIGHRMALTPEVCHEDIYTDDLPFCYKYKSGIHFFGFTISTRWAFFQKEQLPDGVLMSTTTGESIRFKSLIEPWSRFPKEILFFLMG